MLTRSPQNGRMTSLEQTGVSPYERGLRRVLWDLRDYLSDLVIVGGWVPYLYQRYGGFSRWRGPISQTSEVDVLLRRTQVTGKKPLRDLLISNEFRPVDGTQAAVWESDPAAG